jgi:hypothetical protein
MGTMTEKKTLKPLKIWEDVHYQLGIAARTQKRDMQDLGSEFIRDKLIETASGIRSDNKKYDN